VLIVPILLILGFEPQTEPYLSNGLAKSVSSYVERLMEKPKLKIKNAL
jgi:hypothetical protein